ncbi:MAG: AMP phosphorylase [Candidatus Micrarchaeia archaeon]
MRFYVSFVGLETGKNIVMINPEDASELGVSGGDRIKIQTKRDSIAAIVNVSKAVKKKSIIVSEEVKRLLKLRKNEEVEVTLSLQPEAVKAIKAKIDGKELSYKELFEIVKAAVEGSLSEIELTSFVVSLYERGLSFEEASRLSMAMVNVGERLKLNKKRIFDKHSIGGIPGDKTTMLVVPIVASAGLTIPKTSSRAITSAAGTADRVEVLMPVNLSLEEMKEVVEKTNGCMVWGGALHLSPADDIFIQIERPLGIDPLLFPSILSKKKAVGATDLVVDIPVGTTVKIPNVEEAYQLAQKFIKLGGSVGIKVKAAITAGEQPLGSTIGPALEAKEALEVIEGKKNAKDLIDKATTIAGILLEMAGKKEGKKLAYNLLKKKAEKKLREIIEAQGGDPKIRSEDIKIGEKSFDFFAKRSGRILWFDNYDLAQIARIAGAPKDKGAGILLYKKLGESVKEGEKILSVFSSSSVKLKEAEKYSEESNFVRIGDYNEMLYKKVEEETKKREKFILVR